MSDDQMQLIAKALSDPRRYEILKKISAQESPTACSDMRGCIDVTAATLSHHMKELETAGLVRSEKDGKFVLYFAQKDILKAYLSQLQSDLG